VSRLVLLEGGEALTAATAAALASPVRLRLGAAVPPLREGQIVHLRPLDRAPDPRDLVLSRRGDAFGFRLAGARGAPGEEALARLVAVERGPTVRSLERGLLRRLPARWLGPAVDALEVLARLRHPLTPPPFQGAAEDCLARVRAKYGRAAEVREYARTARAGLDPFELALVRRHVRAGGRLLDVGCGAGREALGFARAGFRVVALDIAPAMVEAARANAAGAGLALELRVGSVTELDAPPGTFDGAYFAGSLHHIPGRARRVGALARIRRALTADGALLLVVVYRGPRGLVSRSRLVDLVRRVGARLPGGPRLSEPGDGWMREVSEASDPREAIFFHDYDGPAEVRAELEAAGFVGAEARPGWWVCRPGPPGAGAGFP